MFFHSGCDLISFVHSRFFTVILTKADVDWLASPDSLELAAQVSFAEYRDFAGTFLLLSLVDVPLSKRLFRRQSASPVPLANASFWGRSSSALHVIHCRLPACHRPSGCAFLLHLHADLGRSW